MKTLDSVNFKDKKVLVRVDFNVPLNDKLEVTDATRLEAVKPTIQKIINDGGCCILMSHFGRPKNREAEFSLKNVVKKASQTLGVEVKFADDCISEKAENAVKALKPGEVLLLENLRYYKEETEGDKNFAKQLSALGDFYVNDAFGAAHRAHASTSIIAGFFPDNKCFGYLMEQEIKSIDRVLH